MRRTLTTAALGLTLAFSAVCSRPAAAEPQAGTDPAQVETLFSMARGFLENLTIRDDGAVVFTSYLDKTIRVRTSDGAISVLATLPAYPVGIIAYDGGYIVSAHGASFTDGPGFTSTNQILVLDGTGRVSRTVPAPDARFLNGVLSIGPDRVLIADSIAGTIWALTPSTGALQSWLQSERLAPDATVQPFRPGANGLKQRDGRLYVSNSSRGTVETVSLTSNLAPEGTLTPFAKPGPVDDFTFGPDGQLYAATHGQTLIAITPEGAVRVIMSDGCDSCTSVAISGSGASARLIVLTTGDLVEGGTKPARMLSLPLSPGRAD